jgi:hypothetical protein
VREGVEEGGLVPSSDSEYTRLWARMTQDLTDIATGEHIWIVQTLQSLLREGGREVKSETETEIERGIE